MYYNKLLKSWSEHLHAGHLTKTRCFFCPFLNGLSSLRSLQTYFLIVWTNVGLKLSSSYFFIVKPALNLVLQRSKNELIIGQLYKLASNMNDEHNCFHCYYETWNGETRKYKVFKVSKNRTYQIQKNLRKFGFYL